jgi:hypothetical protein
MAKKRARRKSVRIANLRPGKPLLRGRALKQGFRGVAAVLLGGLRNEGDESKTSVISTSGSDAPDTDTSVTQDHYFA